MQLHSFGREAVAVVGVLALLSVCLLCCENTCAMLAEVLYDTLMVFMLKIGGKWRGKEGYEGRVNQKINFG